MSSNPRVSSSIAPEENATAIHDAQQGLVTEEDAAIDRSLATNDGGRSPVTEQRRDDESLKLITLKITLIGVFSGIEYAQYPGPDSIQKGKKIMDHIGNIREMIEHTVG